ncbi:hypothetical protein RFF05_00505 [Bengtsoniella intestinalis]|uniref:hypothetical protein n=1 Tax=Bengtsoniella intestinalis TaxID=3073143 RepID=UPI00391F2284
MAMQKHFCMRGLSFLLALTLVFGLITPMTMTSHAAENSNVPSNVTVQYSNATDFRGTYYSNNLESKVNIRTIRTSYNYGGEAVNSYGFCLDKGLGLSSNDTYTYASEFASYPAAPFIAFMLSGARYNNWDDTTLQSVQGWVR